MPFDTELSAIVRTIDPILDELVDGAIKGALNGDDLVDIATRIRTILHEAVARQDSVKRPVGDAAAFASSAGG